MIPSREEIPEPGAEPEGVDIEKLIEKLTPKQRARVERIMEEGNLSFGEAARLVLAEDRAEGAQQKE